MPILLVKAKLFHFRIPWFGSSGSDPWFGSPGSDPLVRIPQFLSAAGQDPLVWIPWFGSTGSYPLVRIPWFESLVRIRQIMKICFLILLPSFHKILSMITESYYKKRCLKFLLLYFEFNGFLKKRKKTSIRYAKENDER